MCHQLEFGSVDVTVTLIAALRCLLVVGDETTPGKVCMPGESSLGLSCCYQWRAGHLIDPFNGDQSEEPILIIGIHPDSGTEGGKDVGRLAVNAFGSAATICAIRFSLRRRL